MLRQHLPAEWINLAARHGLETARPLQAEGKTADAGEKFKDRQHLRLPAESADRADPAGSFGEKSVPPDSTDPRMPEGQGRRREARSHPPPPVSPGPKPPLPTRQGGPWTIGVRVHPGEWRARRKRRERITAAPSAAPAGGETTTTHEVDPGISDALHALGAVTAIADPLADCAKFYAKFTRDPFIRPPGIDCTDRPCAHVPRDDGLGPIESINRNHGHHPAISVASFANSIVPASAVTAIAAHAIAGIMPHPAQAAEKRPAAAATARRRSAPRP